MQVKTERNKNFKKHRYQGKKGKIDQEGERNMSCAISPIIRKFVYKNILILKLIKHIRRAQNLGMKR